MKTTRIIFPCLLLACLASMALAATVPNYMSIIQQAEKWYQSEGAGKMATLRIHTLVNGSFNGASILERETLLNGAVIDTERLLFQKDANGNINFWGDMDEFVLDEPIRWVRSPMAIGDSWTDSRPEIPCCGDPENMVHYVFAVLDTKEITCPAGTFDCHRVYLSVVYPDGHTENQTFWYNPHCGMVMWVSDAQRMFELQKAIVPGVGDWPDVAIDDPIDGANISGLKASPNPLNPSTAISFDLRSRSRVQLQVYDVSGKLVRTLVAGQVMDPGQREVTWNGKDDRGGAVASGSYIYRLQAGQTVRTNRMTLIR